MRALLLTWALIVSAGASAGASAGCGYRFAAGGAALLPRGTTEVRSPVFSNQTAEPGLEASFTRAMREQLLRGGISVRSTAKSVVEGTVVNVWATPTVLANTRQTSSLASYRIFATARVRLLESGTPFAATEVSGSEDYLPGVDILQSEANRQAALERLAQRLMRDALQDLSPQG